MRHGEGEAAICRHRRRREAVLDEGSLSAMPDKIIENRQRNSGNQAYRPPAAASAIKSATTFAVAAGIGRGHRLDAANLFNQRRRRAAYRLASTPSADLGSTHNSPHSGEPRARISALMWRKRRRKASSQCFALHQRQLTSQPPNTR